MQFQAGDKVVHPVYGVGVVKDYSEQCFVGEQTKAYYQVIAGTTTVWVPIDDQGVTVLRKIAPKESLNECRKLLRHHPLPLNQDRKIREQELARRLKDKLLPALCEIVRDLTGHAKLKSLGVMENNLLKKTLQSLSAEWAATAGVTVTVALSEIETLLQEGR